MEVQSFGAQPALVRTLRTCVLVAAAAHVMLVILAPFLARYGLIRPAPPERIFFLNEVGGILGVRLTGLSVLDQPFVRAVAYFVPILLATAAFAAALQAIGRERAVSDPRVARILWAGIVAIAGIEVLRLPVLTFDFWLSLAWGRMVVEGVNPYYHSATAESLRGLPLEPIKTRMTYGPLWTGLCALIAMGGSTATSFLLHKLVLAAAWLGMAAFAFRLGARTSPWHGVLALAIVGLVPASSLYTVGEGHNDALVACGAVAFLSYLAGERFWRAGLWLTAASLAKYVSLPLALLALPQLMGKPKREWARAGWIAAACVLLAVLVSLPFVRDRSFMSAALSMRHWEFLTPADAVRAAAALAGIALPADLVANAFLAAFTLIALLAIRRYLRQRTGQALASAALGIMALVVFCIVGHVWPWFVIWLVPVVACAHWNFLAVFVLSFAAVVPLLDLAWLLRDDNELLPALGILVYGLAFGGALLLRAGVFHHEATKGTKA